MKRAHCVMRVAAFLSLGACASAHVKQREGFINVEGGRVWYRVVGHGSRTPVLVVHGGPGANSYYLKPLGALAEDRPVIFYDQLGGGKSDRPADTTIWRIERFVSEITRVREALGLEEIHLYGHSFGATLAVAYMETKPKGVRSLILAGAALVRRRALTDRDSLMHMMPESVYTVIVSHEKDQTLDAPEYEHALRLFQERFFARRLPWSADLDSANAQYNPAGARYYKGGGRGGAGWVEHLGEISIPTLFTVGRFDTSTPAAAAHYQSLVPGAELVVFEQSAHLTMQDEPDHYNAVLRDFLRRVEAQRKPYTKREGFIPVEGGRVWYQVVGSGPNTPLLVIHGGPGVNHLYLKPMAALAVDRPVIFYDQLGGGYSDRPTDTTLWRMDRFVDEIARVREALGLTTVHLYGHSFGASLVAAYMETKPKGVRSVIFAGGLDPQRYRRARDSLIRTLPDSVSSVMIRHQQDQTLDAPEYIRANRVFLEHYHARRIPWSADLDSAIALNNASIGRYIRGGRPLPKYTDHLGEISVPTLFTVGRFDPSTPAAAAYYQSLVPGAELVVFEQSAHLTMHDEPDHYNAVLRDFLRRADAVGQKNIR